MIKTTRIAYNIGYSTSLSLTSISGYLDVARWKMDPKKERKLVVAFLRGWNDGFNFSKSLKKNLVAEVVNSD